MSAPPEPLQTMSQIPVISVEILHLDQLEAALKDPVKVERIAKDIMSRLESQLVGQNATIHSIRKNVLFFSFRDGVSLGQVISKALKVSVALAQKTIPVGHVTLALRIGMDLVPAAEQLPATAVAERMIAKAGQIVVGQALYQLTHKQIPYEAIGPIKVQGQLKNFYRVMTERQKKSAASAPTVQPASSVPASPSPTQDNIPVSEVITSPREELTTPEPSNVSPEPALCEDLPTAYTPLKEPLERRIEPEEAPSTPHWQTPEWLVALPNPRPGTFGYFQALEYLQNELQPYHDNPQSPGKILSLAGPSGCGKTTILNLLRAQMPEDSFYWVGGNFLECFIPDQFPLYFWLELLQNTIMGLPLQSVSLGEGVQHLDNLIQTIFDGQAEPEMLEFLKTFFSLSPLAPVNAQIRQNIGQMVPYIGKLLHVMAQSRPVVMIIENLEYADAASLELLAQLLQQNLLEAPISIIFTQPDNLAFHPGLQNLMHQLPYREITMQIADEATLQSMIEAPLSVPWKKLPDTLRAQLIEKASPLYLEEAFRWLQLKGGFSVNPKTGKYQPEKPLKQLVVPENINHVIAERFTFEEEICRQVLQVASVLGERFSTELLQQMMSHLADLPVSFEDMLTHLWQRVGFICPDTPQMARFRHPLIWQVIRRSVDVAQEQHYHKLAASILENGLSNGLSTNPLFLARHHGMGGNLGDSIRHWEQGAVWLAQTGSVTGANMALGNLQRLMGELPTPPDPAKQRQVALTLGLVNLDVNPEYAKSLLISCLTQYGDVPAAEAIQIRVFLTQAYDALGQYALAVSSLHHAVEIVPSGQLAERLTMLGETVWYLNLQGKYQEALQVYAEDIYPCITDLENPPWRDAVLRHSLLKAELAHARAALMQCKPDKAFETIDRALSVCEIHQEPLLAVSFRLTRSLGYILKGHFEGAQRDADDIFNQIEALGSPPSLMAGWGLMVLQLHIALGDWQNAAMLLPNVSYQAELAKDYYSWAMCQVFAGQISMANKNLKEAQGLFEQAINISAQYGISQTALMGWRALCECAITAGEALQAEEICLRAIDVAQKPHNQNHYEFYQLALTYAKILIEKQLLKEAGTHLEQYWPTMVQSGYTSLIADAAEIIAGLYHRLADELPEPHSAKYRELSQNFTEKAQTLWQEQGNTYRLSKMGQVEAPIT